MENNRLQELDIFKIKIDAINTYKKDLETQICKNCKNLDECPIIEGMINPKAVKEIFINTGFGCNMFMRGEK